MDPKEPSQPPVNTSYTQSDNPTTHTAAEDRAAAQNKATSQNAPKIDHRTAHDVPSSHDEEPTSTALGDGERGPLTSHPLPQSTQESVSNSELDGEQMRAPGEGDIAHAVQHKKEAGGFGEQESLTANMETKKIEHEEKLKKYGLKHDRDEAERQDWSGAGKEVDVNEALGGRGTAVVGVGEGLD